jgi:histone H1/5
MPERKYEIPAGDEIDYAADFEAWLEKGATAKQVQFGDFVADKADLASYFKTAKEVEAAKLGVQLALKWRMLFQRSPENHEATNEAREARAQEAAARPTRKAKAQSEDAEPETPRRRGRPAKAAPAAEEAPAPARRGRRAAAAATPATEAKAPAKPGRRPAAAARTARPPRKGAAKAEADF